MLPLPAQGSLGPLAGTLCRGPSSFCRLRLRSRLKIKSRQTTRDRQLDREAEQSVRAPNLTRPKVFPQTGTGPGADSHLHPEPVWEASAGQGLGGFYRAGVWVVLGLAGRGLWEEWRGHRSCEHQGPFRESLRPLLSSP